MRIALAHDYLTQRGGAERVALIMARTFPGAPMYTSVYQPGQTFDEFREVPIETSALQRVPIIRRDPRVALLALPLAWNRISARSADVVLASSAGWAHAIGVADGARKIVYCHNPARWLYQPDAYVESPLARLLLRGAGPRLRAWDRAAASTADLYLVNSGVVAERVRRIYGIEPEVLHPPVAVDPAAPQRPVAGIEPGFWLTIARGRGYKNTRTVIEGTRLLGEGRLVVVGAPDLRPGDSHVSSLGVVPEDQLRWLFAHARALVSVSEEDFGLTPIEANAFGTPAAVIRAGGYLESTVEGKSGVFIETATAEAVRDALKSLPDIDEKIVRQNAERFSVEAFSARLRALALGEGAA